jgi:hypothetical protein
MKVYFLSELPAALYVGGAYLGTVSNFERFAEISLQDGMPARLDAVGMQPLQFFLSEDLPLSPPLGVDVYRLPEGIALYAHGYLPVDTTLSVIAQVRQGENLATVYRQGVIQLAWNRGAEFFNTTLPPSFCECELFFEGEILLVKSPTELALFLGHGERVLLQRYLSAECADSVLTLRIPLCDHLRRTAICRYRLGSDSAELLSYDLQQGTGSYEGLIAYAFFESVRVGGEFCEFLCEELATNSNDIREFLGEFLYVLPTEKETECMLVYRKSERLFDVRRFTVALADGKITDVSG